jgi:hypothetical protein
MNEKRPSVEKENANSLGFGWGKLWIFFGLFQGSIALIFGLILGKFTEIIPNRILATLAAISCIGSAIGLILRKRIGLYLVYSILIFGTFGNIISIFDGTTKSMGRFILFLPIAYLWFRYFHRRKGWFT